MTFLLNLPTLIETLTAYVHKSSIHRFRQTTRKQILIVSYQYTIIQPSRLSNTTHILPTRKMRKHFPNKQRLNRSRSQTHTLSSSLPVYLSRNSSHQKIPLRPYLFPQPTNLESYPASNILHHCALVAHNRNSILMYWRYHGYPPRPGPPSPASAGCQANPHQTNARASSKMGRKASNSSSPSQHTGEPFNRTGSRWLVLPGSLSSAL